MISLVLNCQITISISLIWSCVSWIRADATICFICLVKVLGFIFLKKCVINSNIRSLVFLGNSFIPISFYSCLISTLICIITITLWSTIKIFNSLSRICLIQGTIVMGCFGIIQSSWIIRLIIERWISLVLGGIISSQSGIKSFVMWFWIVKFYCYIFR